MCYYLTNTKVEAETESCTKHSDCSIKFFTAMNECDRFNVIHTYFTLMPFQFPLTTSNMYLL